MEEERQGKFPIKAQILAFSREHRPPGALRREIRELLCRPARRTAPGECDETADHPAGPWTVDAERRLRTDVIRLLRLSDLIERGTGLVSEMADDLHYLAQRNVDDQHYPKKVQELAA